MYMYDKLPQEDVAQLNRYLNNYSDGGCIPEDKMSHFLRFWDENKAHFFRMFGEKFILDKEVCFEKPREELEDEMDSALYNNVAARRFAKEFKYCVGLIFGDNYDANYALQSFVDSNYTLVRNEYEGSSIVIPAHATKNGRPLQVNTGCKVVKMLGKISSAIGVDVKVRTCKDCGYIDIESDVCPYCGGEVKEMDGYEAFRQTHSQVLNQKKIRGKLCLSIHPLDFLTMSDNDCGWTSCMSWMEEYGDYRMGTVEMMNSPCVVIAYVEAKDKMWVCGRDWSNKKWRQLYIVTPEIILGNKQYPYQSDELQGAAIKWLRDLTTATVGYGPYAEEASSIRNNSWNYINGDKRVSFNFYSNYMYNDIYDSRLAYVAPSRFDDDDRYDLNFSGEAECCQCGEEIEYDTIEAHRVLCRACDGHWRCDCCGDYHSEYDSCYEVGDYLYCDWCYHNELERCECCDERDNNLNHVYIQVVETTNEEIIQSFNYNYYIAMCDSCFNDPDSYEDDFGPMYTVKDMWGMTRKAFDIKNITDRGLRRGDLSTLTIDFLKLMRNAESDEGRLTLIREISY